ncbi:MAG: 1,4-dihydroxy-2-naphthoate octaprenyltransferase [Gammaproteobacteria bacterium]|nr:1,4-dihydroxy-2-naphthoate octaprenyltransferase [Gammaproteobacteria bacterium]
MSQDSTRPIDPVVQDFAGESLARAAKRAFHATRPKFFPASVLPVLVGSAWGAHAAQQFDVIVLLLALLATVCVHAASNVLNDVGDEIIGTDRRNDKRIYPYTGGSRFIQTDILSDSSMARLGVSLLIIAALAGAGLLVERGPLILLFGATGIALCVLYSLGPVKLSTLGLGELAVGIGLGMLPVVGAAWLQGAAINTTLVLFSVPVAIWVAAILLINEVPDIEADGASGKDTLPVRLGLRSTALLYFGMQLAASLIVLLLTAQGTLPPLAPLVPAGLLVLAWRASAAIRTGVDNRDSMTQGIESTLAIHTVGCLWLTGCVLFALWW